MEPDKRDEGLAIFGRIRDEGLATYGRVYLGQGPLGFMRVYKIAKTVINLDGRRPR